MKKITLMVSLLLLGVLSAGFAAAQQPAAGMPPHAGAAMPNMGPTGVVEGSLFSLDSKGKKQPVAGQTVAMMVFENGQQVLMLEKTTDAQGKFIFKNIFKNKAYAYGFGTMYQDSLYVYPHFSLGDKEDVKAVAFQIGNGSPYARDLASMGMPPKAEESAQAPAMGKAPEQHGHDNSWSKPYQQMATVLGVLVLMAAAYFAGKKSS